ncbi:ankyrin repeat protein [Hypoxylon sp. NC1633]|nr:ankyrin repeat protein [Hypoxylon sp. NC1633]
MSETDKKTVKEESVLGQKKASMEEESLHPVSLTHNDYTVGWVCALPKEQTAALAMLDQRHPQLSKPPNDHNTYTLGSIGRHNIVIACLPKGQIGTNSAATVATRMVGTFPSIKFGLMVGIGGGIPPKVRLGDVVVSTPVGQHPGVVQWDLGKAEEGGKFERTGALNNPPSELLSALTILESEHALNGTKIPQYLGEISQKWPNLAPRYLWSDSLKDPLFSTDDSHTRINWERIIASLAGFLIDISQRKPGEMRVYYGLIASGNQVIKDAKFRNRLNDSLGGNVLCVEMEAAGLKDFPCLVVRGICDYADSHKNKDWQEHAAAVAAAFSKEFLMVVPTQDVEQMPMIKLLQDIDGRLEKVSKTIDQQGDERVLSWLSPNDYTIQQNQFLQRRQPGTGHWLGEAYQTLFCPGIPGAGKTTLAFSEDRTIGIAYIYCDFRRKDEQSFEQLLQLAVPEIGGRQSVLGLFSRVFVVIDALDECDVNCRNKLVKWMFDLQAEQGINIIATSRLVTEIANQFRGCSSLEIRARDGDIRSYVDGCLLKLQASVRESIVEAVGGMCVSTGTAIYRFQKHRQDSSEDERHEALAHAYDETMSRVKGQHEEHRQLAEKVLLWIAYAQRPLTTSELQHALGVELDSHDLDKENIPQVELMTSVCAGLVIADSSGFIRLVHATAQDFFEETKEKWFPNAEAYITNVCVSYLSFNCFTNGRCRTDYEFEKNEYLYPFHPYATGNWGHHARRASDCSHRIIDFLETMMTVREHSVGHKYSQRPPEGVTGLHLAACFGLESIVSALISRNHDPNSKDEFGRTPLSWAAENGHVMVDLADIDHRTPLMWAIRGGHEEMLHLLIEEMASINSVDVFGVTPLHLAARRGHSTAVSLLLKHGANANRKEADARDKLGRTPLSYAAEHGHEAILKYLLGMGVDADPRDYYKRTPLSYAAEHGHEAILKYLLEMGVEADPRDFHKQRTPLSYAAEHGPEAILKYLLGMGVEADLSDQEGRTPLSYAAEHGHEAILKYLLEMGVETNLKNKYGETPLSYAAFNGHAAVVKLLLEQGVEPRHDINELLEDRASGRSCQTPLSYAAEKGSVATVQLLLEYDVDLESKGEFGYTPLLYAVMRGHTAFVRLLLEKGADPITETNWGKTALSFAKSEEMVKLLEMAIESEVYSGFALLGWN